MVTLRYKASAFLVTEGQLCVKMVILDLFGSKNDILEPFLPYRRPCQNVQSFHAQFCSLKWFLAYFRGNREYGREYTRGLFGLFKWFTCIFYIIVGVI